MVAFERDRVRASSRVLPQCNDSRWSMLARPTSQRHSQASDAEHGASRIVGENARVASGPPIHNLRAIKKQGYHQIGTYCTHHTGHWLLSREILADEVAHGKPPVGCHEVEFPLRHIDIFPPLFRRMKRRSKMILMNLASIDAPPVVLVLLPRQPVTVEMNPKVCEIL